MDKEILDILKELGAKNNKSRTFRRAYKEIMESHKLISNIVFELEERDISIDNEVFERAKEVRDYFCP